MPGNWGWPGPGSPGGRHARTVRSASKRARRSAAYGPRARRAGRGWPGGRGRCRCAAPGPPAGGTGPSAGCWRHRAVRAAARPGDGRHGVGMFQQVVKPPGIVAQRPGGGPAAQRGSRRRRSRAVISSLTLTVRVVPSAVSNSSHCRDTPASGNTAAASSLSSDSASSSRSGPLGSPLSSMAAISLAVTRSHLWHVHSSSAASEPGSVPRPPVPRSRLTASWWRVLDPHPHGERRSSRHSSPESPAAISSSIAGSPSAAVASLQPMSATATATEDRQRSAIGDRSAAGPAPGLR
jgi:hypothetical protein